MKVKEKKYIEERLYNLLDELLAYGNQDGSILKLDYDPSLNMCTVELKVVIINKDDYIGFQGY